MKQIKITDFELIRFYIMTWAFTFYIFGINGKVFGKQIDGSLVGINLFYSTETKTIYIELELFYYHIFTKSFKLWK